jgi:outer membrane protein TolC
VTRCAALVLICLAGTCAAQPPTEALELPPTPLVEKALAAYPPVQAAREGVRFELAGKRRLDVGPYEFAIRGGYQSHTLPNGRFPEFEFGLERPLRLPEKARLDRELGVQGVELARRIAYSAWCDGARHLLQLWYAWARENMQLAIWTQQAQALREQVDVVSRRAAAGDAPRVEVNLAEASAAQAEAVVENFRGREQGARGALDRTFPAIAVPASARIGRPRPLEQGLDWFVEQVRLHNDEIRVARAAARRGLVAARRAGAERLPDPAIGVRIATDRSNADRIAGLFVVVPIPGDARRAFADGARAQAAVAASQEAAVVQRVTAEVAQMYGQATGAFRAWEKARSAADGMQRNAVSTLRSWQLREAPLSEVLIARRLALEAALTAAMAQIDAEETRYRLLIEAHILWNDPEEEASPHED